MVPHVVWIYRNQYCYNTNSSYKELPKKYNEAMVKKSELTTEKTIYETTECFWENQEQWASERLCLTTI